MRRPALPGYSRIVVRRRTPAPTGLVRGRTRAQLDRLLAGLTRAERARVLDGLTSAVLARLGLPR